jgi:DNA end-binding protein Ku
MPRSIWNGTITLGLTAVPIKVHSATEDRTIHFHQVHESDGARIKQRRVCSAEEIEVPYDEVAKGYPLDEGGFVMLTNEEISAAGGERSRVIELEEFIHVDEIDPIHYEKGYYLGTGSTGQAAYRLLHDALAKSSRVGIGRWVFHNREYLVAVRAIDRVLVMHTMRFADELVDPGTLDLRDPSRAPTDREIEMAGLLVDALHGEFDPASYQDSYRERVLALIDSKAQGIEPEMPEAPEPAPVPDLMAALEASLKAAGKSGAGRSASKSAASKPKSPTSTPKSPNGKAKPPTAKPKSKAAS